MYTRLIKVDSNTNKASFYDYLFQTKKWWGWVILDKFDYFIPTRIYWYADKHTPLAQTTLIIARKWCFHRYHFNTFAYHQFSNFSLSTISTTSSISTMSFWPKIPKSPQNAHTHPKGRFDQKVQKMQKMQNSYFHTFIVIEVGHFGQIWLFYTNPYILICW